MALNVKTPSHFLQACRYATDGQPNYKDPASKPEWWHPDIPWAHGPNSGPASRKSCSQSNFLRMCAYYDITVANHPVTLDDANRYFKV